MSYGISCHECEQTVYPPVEAEGPGGQSEIAAHQLALQHVRETGHTEIYVLAGCYWWGDGPRPTAFEDGETTDPEDVRVTDKSELADAVETAARALRKSADDIEEWRDPEMVAEHLRRMAGAVESHLQYADDAGDSP